MITKERATICKNKVDEAIVWRSCRVFAADGAMNQRRSAIVVERWVEDKRQRCENEGDGEQQQWFAR